MYEATYSKLFQATVQIPAAKVAEKAPALHRLCSVHSFSLRDWSSPSQAKADMCNIQGIQGHTANPQTYARRLPLPSMSAWKLELWELVRPWGHGTNDTTAIAACCRKLSASGHATRIAASTQGGERGETLERSAMPCHAMPCHGMPCHAVHLCISCFGPYGPMVLKTKYDPPVISCAFYLSIRTFQHPRADLCLAKPPPCHQAGPSMILDVAVQRSTTVVATARNSQSCTWLYMYIFIYAEYIWIHNLYINVRIYIYIYISDCILNISKSYGVLTWSNLGWGPNLPTVSGRSSTWQARPNPPKISQNRFKQ